MQSVKLLTSELTWCLRCSMRIGHRKLAAQSLAVPVSQKRFYSAEVIPPVTLEGEEKTYAPKIQKLVKDISQLTLIEVADLNALLKKTLKISDAPMMAVGAMPSASKNAEQDEEVQEVKKEKVNFTVKVVKFDAAKKTLLIKAIKELVQGTNLVQAKKFVESLPQSVRTDIPKEEAEQLKAKLEEAGGTVLME